MNYLKEIPAVAYLLVIFLVLCIGWEVRPDAIVQSLLVQAFAALVMALVPNKPNQPVPTVEEKHK